MEIKKPVSLQTANENIECCQEALNSCANKIANE